VFGLLIGLEKRSTTLDVFEIKERLKIKGFTRKNIIFFIINCVIVILLILTFGKWWCYEYFTDIDDLRKHIGKHVVYKVDNKTQIDGVLTSCKYKFNDCIGFFDLEITIKGTEKTFYESQIFF
jgi:hypothetical protein